MSIIRFSTDEVFDTDSSDYHILANAVSKIKGISGAVVEIGTRKGGSAKLIIDTLVANEDTNRPMFCIDPYGNIDYPATNYSVSVHYPSLKIEGDKESKEQTTNIKLDYDNTMRNRTIPSLYYYAYQAGLNFTFFCLEDTEFITRYTDGVPLYDEYKTLCNNYAFVFFDGPHDWDSLHLETHFFMDRSVEGSVFVYDDVWMYDHDKLEQILIDNGWSILEKSHVKASYIKNKLD